MKLYDRKEIGAILKKAAESSSPEDDVSPLGLSVEELKQLASEAGIDPDQIVKAIAEVEIESHASKRTFWGGPFSASNQVVVDREISIGQWEEMLISIREFFQSKGEVDVRESVLEWSSPRGTTNSAQVTVLKDHGKTKISIGWNGPLSALPFYLPVPFAAVAFLLFASGFLELSAVPGVSLTLFLSGLTFLAARWALGNHMDKGFSKISQLMTRLEAIAEQQRGESGIPLKHEGTSATSAIPEPVLQITEEETDVESDFESQPEGRSRV
jgi:hypothetical protein